MKWPRSVWLVGHVEHGEKPWLPSNDPDDVIRLWEPSQRRRYILAPRKRKKATQRPKS